VCGLVHGVRVPGVRDTQDDEIETGDQDCIEAYSRRSADALREIRRVRWQYPPDNQDISRRRVPQRMMVDVQGRYSVPEHPPSSKS
jgi:hypothetical protein